MPDLPKLPYRTWGNHRLVPKRPRPIFGIGPGRRVHIALPESPTLYPGVPVGPVDSPAEAALRGILGRSETQVHTQNPNMPNPPHPDIDLSPPEPLPARPSSATSHSTRSTTVVSPRPTVSRPQARASTPSASTATLTRSPDRSSPTRVVGDQQLPTHNSAVTVVSATINIPKEERHDPHSTVGRMARLREYLRSTAKKAGSIHPPATPHAHVPDSQPVEEAVSESLVSRSGPLVELGTRGGPPPVTSNCRIPRRFAYEIDGPTLPSMINQVMMLLDAVVPVWGSHEVNFVIYQTVSTLCIIA